MWHYAAVISCKLVSGEVDNGMGTTPGGYTMRLTSDTSGERNPQPANAGWVLPHAGMRGQ